MGRMIFGSTAGAAYILLIRIISVLTGREPVPDLDGENVYYLPRGKRSAVAVANDLKKPNGIVGVPGGFFVCFGSRGWENV